jgi:PKHD-type hydroxylase
MTATPLRRAARVESFRTSAHVASPVCLPSVFTAAECDSVLALGGDRLRYESSLSNPIAGYRSARTLWMERDKKTAWLDRRLEEVIAKVNALYGFDVIGLREPHLLAQYRKGDGFKWHLDVNETSTSTRKLSISVQLSVDGDYDGGRLQFMPMGEIPFSRDRGTVIVFPSYLCHRVTRVTRGMRSALIAWAHGNTFA